MSVEVNVEEQPTERIQSDLTTRWLLPIFSLISLALLVFTGFYMLDFLAVDSPRSSYSALHSYLDFNSDYMTDAVPALGMTIVAVLGIILTVVAIIVQLSSDRYTGVAIMFMRDGINIAVMVYFIVSSVCAIWLSVSLQDDFVPRSLVIMMLLVASIGLSLMLPYFYYVFWFLEPSNIVMRIRQGADRMLVAAIKSKSPEYSKSAQAHVINALEEITDIANNSIDGKDKIIASRAVDALKDFAIGYIVSKPAADHPWFIISESVRKNPDFVAMEPESIDEIQSEHTWMEWKILRQYLGIFNEALATMPDITYLVAIDCRYIGEAAADASHTELSKLVFRYMNSFLRAAINARNVRVAYNILHQYRKLIEYMMMNGHYEIVKTTVRYLKYYSHISYKENLPFISETIAFDITGLCQLAHSLGVENETLILEKFLEPDDPVGYHSSERSLVGVRKAQIKLATYYLLVGADEKAQLLARDMIHERAIDLQAIRHHLEQSTELTFWEVVDRGRNFEYLSPAQREQIGKFFDKLTEAPPPKRRSTDH